MQEILQAGGVATIAIAGAHLGVVLLQHGGVAIPVTCRVHSRLFRPLFIIMIIIIMIIIIMIIIIMIIMNVIVGISGLITHLALGSGIHPQLLITRTSSRTAGREVSLAILVHILYTV